MTDSNEPLERLLETTEPLEQQIEQQIHQYEAHLKHFDELLERVKAGAAGMTDQARVSAQIEKAQSERERIAAHLEKLKKMSPEERSRDLMGKAGPMGIWDAVAGQLERLAERIEHRGR